MARPPAPAALLVTLALLLAGCLGAAPLDAAGDDTRTDPTDTPGSSPSPAPPGADDGNTTGGGGTGNGGAGDGNTTNGNETGGEGDQNVTIPPPQWPDIANAKVRPGVEVIIDDAQCTSNFVFRSRTNGTLYLGVAAHCLNTATVGAEARIRDTNGQTVITSHVAYSSWAAINFTAPTGQVGDFHAHDFALIEIPKADEGIIHPAALHFGGPTALGTWDGISAGDSVIVYGSSNLYPRPEPLNWQEGFVLFKAEDNQAGSTGHYVSTSMPFLPVPGDSGSGLMTKDGKAIGVLHTFGPCTYGICWNYSSIPHAVEYINTHGWDIELQTWDLLDAGLLP